MVQLYRNDGGDTGIARFSLGHDSITLEFKDGSTYLYTHTVPGKNHVEQMKKLALAGKGLTTYVNQYVRGRYAKKLR